MTGEFAADFNSVFTRRRIILFVPWGLLTLNTDKAVSFVGGFGESIFEMSFIWIS